MAARQFHALSQIGWLRYVTFAGVVALILTGCGVDYAVEGARLNISGVNDLRKQQVLDVVSSFLRKEGFEDFGRYDAMTDLIRQNNAMPTEVKERELARLNRELTFLNSPHHLRVIWSDFSNATPADLAQLRYTPSSLQFVEISIYEERPGGFSAAGQRFYQRFLVDLKDHYGDSVVVVTGPSANNELKFVSITIVNVMATIFWSTTTLLVSFALTGTLTKAVLKGLRLPLLAKRIIFVTFNAWLVAPLPFPATIVAVPAPNLFAFPWTDFGFYSHVASYAAISFPGTILVCSLVSVRVFKGRTGNIAMQT